MKSRISKIRLFLMMIVAVCLSFCAQIQAADYFTTVFAQQGKTAEKVVDLTKTGPSYTLEVFIILILVSGALFAVCKSSRRA